MATTGFISETLRTYIDEPDQTFVDSTLLVKFLQIGYQEFRNTAIMFDPNIYARTATFTLSSASQLDLTTAVPTGFAGPLLGSTAAAGEQLEMFVTLYLHNESGASPTLVYQSVQSMEALQSTPSAYLFSNGVLSFAYEITGTVKLVFVPSSNVDWSAAAGYIDDLTLFHDLIALYSYKQYAIMDAAHNQVLIYQLEKREREFKDYLNTRSVGGANYVQDVSSSQYWL
jgi:hypothetical protein